MTPDLFECVRPFLQPIALKRRTILQEHNRPIEHVYFIERGVASLFARTQRDGPVEVSIVGRLGFVGVAAVLGTMRSPNRCWMQVPGEALRITSKDLRRLMDDTPAVRQHLLNYVHALLMQNTQTALCNVRHELEERLCRWLLLASDRLDEKAIPRLPGSNCRATENNPRSELIESAGGEPLHRLNLPTHGDRKTAWR